jgi:RND family efflux transporter MFP subunit
MKYVNYFYRVISAILLLLFSWLPQVVCAQTIAAAEKPVSQVAIMTVSKDVALVRQVLGTVFAPQMQTISSQVTAVVTSDRLGMGTRVEKGDVLVSLDSREADAKLALALSEVMSARIHLEKQTLDFARVEQTFAKKLISKADYDNAKLALRKASNDLKGFEAKYEVAKIFVEKHRILAPFSGVLMTNTPVVGLQLSPGQEVVNILNADELRIKTLLTRDELTNIRIGQAQLLESNQPKASFRLLHAAPNASDTNGMFEAEFSIITVPGLTASHLVHSAGTAGAAQLSAEFQADFYSGQALKLALFENKIHLPEQAILQSTGKDYVMAVSNDQVMKVAIKDLVVGQHVVVQGPSHLMPGDKVAILALEE